MIIDLERAFSLVGGDKELLKEILKLFVEDASAKLKDMKKALDENDMGRMKMLAHALKGASSSIAADTVTEITREIESGVTDGDPQYYQGRLEILERELVKLETEISNYLASN